MKSEEGHKEVLSITVGDNESAKFWLSVLNELKNRGARDIFVLCTDGLSGISEAISAAFPMTEYQWYTDIAEGESNSKICAFKL